MKRKYEKPTACRVKGLDFVLRSIRTKWTRICRQCTSCHGCR